MVTHRDFHCSPTFAVTPIDKSSSVMILGHLVAKTAPFTSSGSVLVAFVKLDILNGMTEAKFIDTSAANDTAVNLNDGQIVDKFLSIAHVGRCRKL